MAETAPTHLGPYEIVSRLGKGGMGEVWKARDPRLNRDVAIKISAQQFTDRFEREAHAIAALNHKNICTLYDVGPNYLVMELVEGPTLAERIAQGPMPLEEALGIARQIVDALEAAHEKPIVHRDLKPANIKIKPDGQVKVLDFGLAKLGEVPELTSDSPTMLTVAGMILGTAGYMAPEQARGKDADKQADIWAFGVVLYEMLTGQRLFEGETVGDTLAAVIKEEPDLTTVPARVQRLLRACLQKDLKNRLQAIGDSRLLLEEDTPAPLVAASSVTRWLWPALAGGLAVALLLSLWAWSPWRDTKPVDQPLVRLNVDLGTDVGFINTGAGSRIILSPDGGRLVYMSRGRIYTRRLDQTGDNEMAGTEGASAPFFSPDGRWVAFFAEGKLKKISVDGGAAITLGDSLGPAGGSWGDDGNIVAASSNGSLARISSSGGTPAPVTKLAPGEVTHRWPQVLPGSQAALFTSNSSFGDGFDAANIEVVSLKDGQRKTLQRGGTYGRYVPAEKGPGHLIFANQGTLFAVPFDLDRLEVRGVPVPVVQGVSTGTGGAAQLDFSRGGTLVFRNGGGGADLRTVQWLDGAGKAQPLVAKAGRYSQLRLSPDGQRLALSAIAGSNQDIWVYEWQRGTMTRLTFGGQNAFPVWSPDGRYVVFEGGSGMLWTRADGAGKPQPLTQSKNPQYPFSFTPDGKRLAFYETGTALNDLWTVPVESDGAALRAGKPEIFLQTPFDERDPAFSPDGHWLAYSSNESGAAEVYVRAFPDQGGRWQISNGGGTRPRWSRDGHELIFQSGPGFMTAGYAVKGETFVAEKPRAWIAGQVSALTDYDVTPDGKRVVAIQPTDAQGEPESQNHVTFLLNFADELRRRSQ